MIRTLFIIAGAALVLCVVTVGGSLALGGHDLQRHGWAWTFKDDNGESVRFERVKGGGTDDLGPFTVPEGQIMAMGGGGSAVQRRQHRIADQSFGEGHDHRRLVAADHGPEVQKPRIGHVLQDVGHAAAPG